MLTDIFAERYAGRLLWQDITEVESKLLVQCFRLIAEQLFPGPVEGGVGAKWLSVHDRLSMELGREQLAPGPLAAAFGIDMLCRDFMLGKNTHVVSADRFMKERISFVELAFRLREEEIATNNRELPGQVAKAELKGKLVTTRHGMALLRKAGSTELKRSTNR